MIRKNVFNEIFNISTKSSVVFIEVAVLEQLQQLSVSIFVVLFVVLSLHSANRHNPQFSLFSRYWGNPLNKPRNIYMHISINPEYFDLIPYTPSKYSFSIDVSDLKGMTITAVVYKEDDESLLIHLNTHVLEMIHHQDCCETVYLADVVGSFEDLIGYPLLEVSESIVCTPTECESATASYYNFKTLKSSVQLRWVGESNGYYSETVNCYLYPTGD